MHPPGRGLRPLQGEWVMASLGTGKATSSDVSKLYKLSIKGDRWMLTATKKDKTTTWSIKVDPSKKPMTIDVFVTEGDKRKIAWRGIYKLEGDSLLIYYNTPGGVRPTNFRDANQNNAPVYLMKYRRVRDDKKGGR